MLSHWQRRNDFYTTHRCLDQERDSKIHNVAFRNIASHFTVKRIDIVYLPTDGLSIYLHPSVFYIDKVKNLAKIFFNDAAYDFHYLPKYNPSNWPWLEEDLNDLLSFKIGDSIKIKIPSLDLLPKLKNLFVELNKFNTKLIFDNKVYPYIEFDDALIFEFNNILNFVFKNNPKLINHNEHIIPELIEYKILNPLYNDATELLEYLSCNRNPDKQIVRNYLRSGMDPYQSDMLNDNCSTYALRAEDDDILRLTIYYGGKDIIFATNMRYFDSENLFEQARLLNDSSKFNILLSAIQSLERQIAGIGVKNITVSEEKDDITIKIDFENNEKISTRWITSHHFNQQSMSEIKNVVFQLFQATFKKDSDPTFVSKDFNKNFCSEYNKWVEVIIYKGVIVGFLLSRVVLDKGEIILKAEYSYLHQNMFFNGSIMRMFTTGPAIALKVMTNVVAKLYYIASSENSAASMNGHLSTLKYITSLENQAQMQRLVDEEFDEKVQIIDGNLIEHEKLLTVVKREATSAMPVSFERQCFRDFVFANNKKQNQQKPRGVLIFTLIGDLFLYVESKKLAPHGVNLEKHVEQISLMLSKKTSRYAPILQQVASTTVITRPVFKLGDERVGFWGSTSDKKNAATKQPDVKNASLPAMRPRSKL